MSINDAVQVLRELRELEQQGVKLPYRPAFILQQEVRGHVVDLETGAIVLGGAADRHTGPAKGTKCHS